MIQIPSSVTAEEAEALAELARDRVVLELGSWLGFSTVAMATTAIRVHSVDWHRGDPHAGDEETAARFLENINEAGLQDRVVAHVGRSEVVLPVLRPASFDFGFHDAFHETRAVYTDAMMMLPLLRPGSLLAFHDFGLFGVADALTELGRPVTRLAGTLATVTA